MLLESLAKPEEVIESDEDLDDVEGEQPENGANKLHLVLFFFFID